MRYAVLFPGQGSQFVGMGEDVFATRADLLGLPADRILGWSLAEVCSEGHEDELTRTDRAQPALFAVSYALWSAFSGSMPHPPSAAAGHSLGEYTALAAAGSIHYEDGLELVEARGTAMALAAAAAEPSGMAALIGPDLETAEALCTARRDDGGKLWVANVNSWHQIVVAGGAGDIQWVVDHGKEHGVRRAIPLKVAGAFHSPFMDPAAHALHAALQHIDFHPPRFPVYANVSATPTRDIASDLEAQLTGTVLFAETIAAMEAKGISTFVHIGPGDATAGLAKRSAQEATVHTVSSLDDVDTVTQRLAVQ
jgi:[acyl-carrier-protein] S-malonyltransferase